MGQFLLDFCNKMISGFAATLTAIFNLLPDSPFKLIDSSPIQPYLNSLNWLIPINTMISEVELLVPAVLGYYIWVVVLRWLKAVE